MAGVFDAAGGGVKKEALSKVKSNMEKHSAWMKLGRGYDKRDSMEGLKSTEEIGAKSLSGTVTKYNSSISNEDRIKDTPYDSFFPILAKFFRQSYSNDKVVLKEVKMALANLVSQGFNVDYLPAGATFDITNNKITVIHAGKKLADGLSLFNRETSAPPAPEPAPPAPEPAPPAPEPAPPAPEPAPPAPEPAPPVPEPAPSVAEPVPAPGSDSSLLEKELGGYENFEAKARAEEILSFVESEGYSDEFDVDEIVPSTGTVYLARAGKLRLELQYDLDENGYYAFAYDEDGKVAPDLYGVDLDVKDGGFYAGLKTRSETERILWIVKSSVSRHPVVSVDEIVKAVDASVSTPKEKKEREESLDQVYANLLHELEGSSSRLKKLGFAPTGALELQTEFLPGMSFSVNILADGSGRYQIEDPLDPKMNRKGDSIEVISHLNGRVSRLKAAYDFLIQSGERGPFHRNTNGYGIILEADKEVDYGPSQKSTRDIMKEPVVDFAKDEGIDKQFLSKGGELKELATRGFRDEMVINLNLLVSTGKVDSIEKEVQKQREMKRRKLVERIMSQSLPENLMRLDPKDLQKIDWDDGVLRSTPFSLEGNKLMVDVDWTDGEDLFLLDLTEENLNENSDFDSIGQLVDMLNERSEDCKILAQFAAMPQRLKKEIKEDGEWKVLDEEETAYFIHLAPFFYGREGYSFEPRKTSFDKRSTVYVYKDGVKVLRLAYKQSKSDKPYIMFPQGNENYLEAFYDSEKKTSKWMSAQGVEAVLDAIDAANL